MGLIYKVTNLTNNNMYIGKTTKPLDCRWRQHLRDADNPNKNTVLGRAINKYGKESFKIEVIVDDLPEEFLDAAETYWIDHFNTFKGVGYNCTEGGDGTSGVKPWNTGKVGVFSKDVLERMRQAKLGKTPVNLEQLRLLAINRTGHKHHNAKKANIYDYKTNKLIASSVVINEWCRNNNNNPGNLAATARGVKPHAKGVYAKYV